MNSDEEKVWRRIRPIPTVPPLSVYHHDPAGPIELFPDIVTEIIDVLPQFVADTLETPEAAACNKLLDHFDASSEPNFGGDCMNYLLDGCVILLICVIVVKTVLRNWRSRQPNELSPSEDVYKSLVDLRK